MNVSLRSKHQAPKREAFGCRDAPPRFIRGRRSRGLAPGWQTKGAQASGLYVHRQDTYATLRVQAVLLGLVGLLLSKLAGCLEIEV